MKLVVDNKFKRAFKRLIKKNPQLQAKILGILDLLEVDPFTPSLKSHKLTGELDGYWSCSVSYDCRIIFYLIGVLIMSSEWSRANGSKFYNP